MDLSPPASHLFAYDIYIGIKYVLTISVSPKNKFKGGGVNSRVGEIYKLLCFKVTVY